MRLVDTSSERQAPSARQDESVVLAADEARRPARSLTVDGDDVRLELRDGGGLHSVHEDLVRRLAQKRRRDYFAERGSDPALQAHRLTPSSPIERRGDGSGTPPWARRRPGGAADRRLESRSRDASAAHPPSRAGRSPPRRPPAPRCGPWPRPPRWEDEGRAWP